MIQFYPVIQRAYQNCNTLTPKLNDSVLSCYSKSLPELQHSRTQTKRFSSILLFKELNQTAAYSYPNYMIQFYPVIQRAYQNCNTLTPKLNDSLLSCYSKSLPELQHSHTQTKRFSTILIYKEPARTATHSPKLNDSVLPCYSKNLPEHSLPS
jgi:hypothetical protein